LIVFRVVQAVGAALLQANSVALVTTSAPPERMRAALGVQAGAQALGLALGPTIGGLLVGTVGWRWVYFINLPVGLVAVVAGYYLLPRTRQRCSAAGLDWVGVGLLAMASTSLLLGVSAASGLALPAGAEAASFALALVCAWAFVRRQRRTTHPLVDLSLLANRAVSSGLVGALCGYLVLFGPLVLVPIILTDRGMSDLGAGLVLTALPAGFAVAATVTNRFLPRPWTDRGRALLGAAIATVALGAGLLAPLTPETLVPILALTGLGLGTFTPSNNTAIMSAIPARLSGTGGGLLNMTRGLGTALGVSVVAMALHLGGAGGGFNRDRLAFAVLVLSGTGAMITTWASTRHRR
jgi:MFS family permease